MENNIELKPNLILIGKALELMPIITTANGNQYRKILVEINEGRYRPTVINLWGNRVNSCKLGNYYRFFLSLEHTTSPDGCLYPTIAAYRIEQYFIKTNQ